MKNHTVPIQEVFNNRFFVVPDYQRGYAWEKQQCLDLLEDLELLPEKLQHYTGTFVFHPNGGTVQDEEGETYEGFDIVDGQQRLTSIVILLAVIGNFFELDEANSMLSKGIEKKYIKATRSVDGNPFFKLTLNKDCRDFFQNDILGEPGVAGRTILSHHRLAEAKETFEAFLHQKKKSLDIQFFPWLKDFRSKIVNRLRVGMHKVDSSAEVGVIFEVMNNRGKDLTELEKVKNYFLYLTTKIAFEKEDGKELIDGLVDKINSTWSSRRDFCFVTSCEI